MLAFLIALASCRKKIYIYKSHGHHRINKRIPAQPNNDWIFPDTMSVVIKDNAIIYDRMAGDFFFKRYLKKGERVKVIDYFDKEKGLVYVTTQRGGFHGYVYDDVLNDYYYEGLNEQIYSPYPVTGYVEVKEEPSESSKTIAKLHDCDWVKVLYAKKGEPWIKVEVDVITELSDDCTPEELERFLTQSTAVGYIHPEDLY
ncbi:hypothetical protein GPJ56_007953 [Histomonas meleagridis]|uniref:uncharacterized protein n=1 Tax=Histomonas meleagridis TaxID=135588 RepID=UPI00355A01B5|nr:hypothetical protein GPJ56_007953 [Histomonas meleagridis]KAH0803895.1 hypothetical protein GO595_002725 [Histomonas meleagridis]